MKKNRNTVVRHDRDQRAAFAHNVSARGPRLDPPRPGLRVSLLSPLRVCCMCGPAAARPPVMLLLPLLVLLVLNQSCVVIPIVHTYDDSGLLSYLGRLSPFGIPTVTSRSEGEYHLPSFSRRTARRDGYFCYSSALLLLRRFTRL